MLYIDLVCGTDNDYIHDIDVWFDTVYEPSWIDNDFARAVIKDIDQSEVVAPRIIDSPWLGYVDPTHLAGGTKCILCLMFDDSGRNFDITVCGDNCAKWIQLVAASRDIKVQLEYLMLFDENSPFEITVVNNGKIVRNQADWLVAYAEVLHER